MGRAGVGRGRNWSLQDAKNKLSEVVDAALEGHPQVVTRRGVKTAVVLSYEAYARVAAIVATPRPPFEAFLRSVPKAPTAAEGGFERTSLALRDVDLSSNSK